MPESPINLNLARIVHRVLTHSRGWQIDELQSELGIAQRTYRKYREVLTEQFEPFTRPDGQSALREVKEGDKRWLRVVGETLHVQERSFAARLAALYLARQMFEFLAETDVANAMSDLMHEFRSRIHDPGFVLDHMLRNVDRLFYYVPHAPKDYSWQGDTLRTILNALLYRRPLTLDYDPASGKRRMYKVNPLTLMSYRNGLYLVAQSLPSLERRTFAVDRILGVQPLPGHFDYPEVDDYDPASVSVGNFGIFQPQSPSDIRVELIFANEKYIKRDLTERVWHPSQEFLDLPDGRLAMSFRVNSLVEVRPWVLSYGDKVEIVSPPPTSNLWHPG